MEYKVLTKEFPSATGMIKTVNSITIKAIEVDRTKDKLNVNFFVSFNGNTKDASGKLQQNENTAINLHSDFLVRSIQEQIYGGEKPTLVQDATEQEITEYETELSLYESKESIAKSQIYPLLSGLLVGTFAQAYGAATALASQYNYTLLPIEEQ